MTTVRLDPTRPLVQQMMLVAAEAADDHPPQVIADMMLATMISARLIGMDDLNDLKTMIDAGHQNAIAAAMALEVDDDTGS